MVGNEEVAFSLVAADRVYVNGAPTDSPDRRVASGDAIRIVEPPRFVSRGGAKLDGALDALSLDVTGVVAFDIGSSTGGFTDCLLQRGASRVVAVDVGRGLLHERLAVDPRVEVLEGRDVRDLETDSSRRSSADLVVVDLSFISIRLVAGHLAGLVRPGGRLLCLVKPQFESTRDEASRGAGVIKDESVRARVLGEVRSELESVGLRWIVSVESTVTGRKGNREVFLLAERPER